MLGVAVGQVGQLVVGASDRQRQFLRLRRLHEGEVAALVGECLGGRHRQAGDLSCRKSWIDGNPLKVVAEIDTHCRGELDHLQLLLSELARSGARRVGPTACGAEMVILDAVDDEPCCRLDIPKTTSAQEKVGPLAWVVQIGLLRKKEIPVIGALHGR
jgi:hypothetical protein